MLFTLRETQLGLRNSTTRIPFRYGSACLTRCPQAILRVLIEVDGKRQAGYSGDCLPPSWFDKSPGKPYAQQIDDMLAVIQLAEKTFLEEMSGATRFFPAWLCAYERVHSRAAEWAMTPLLTSFGASMVERAVMDALARAAGVGLAKAVRANLYGLEPGEIHPALQRQRPCDWLPATPTQSIYVRHTVGLADPLTAADIPADEQLDDGFPQALEQYVQQTGTCYFKIKVANQLDQDVQRLATIAQLVERHLGQKYFVTLDGNEQYKQASEFVALIEAMQSSDALQTLWTNTLVIEQPLERSVALSGESAMAIEDLCRHKPVIIDESDGLLTSYPRAIEIGYRGVSSKNCKGAIKSLMNAGLTWLHNRQGHDRRYVMTGEDLCAVGITAMQSDLCLVATLGLEHSERNGHHYHPGLSYLPQSQQEAALAAHGDFYQRRAGRVAPRLVDGKFHIGSLQCAGFGFAVEPDLASMQSPHQWQFSSLGLQP